jgi:hypothetical protein
MNEFVKLFERFVVASELQANAYQQAAKAMAESADGVRRCAECQEAEERRSKIKDVAGKMGRFLHEADDQAKEEG